MDFILARDYIESEFEMYGFTDRVGRELFNIDRLLVSKLSFGSRVELSFPGTKAVIEPNPVYDFRVDLYTPYTRGRQSLSHVNLLVDIAHKCRRQPSMIPYIRKTICNIYEKGLYNMVYLPCGCEEIGKDLLREVEKIHTTIFHNGRQKKYHAFLNKRSLAYEDLFTVIFWVYLQEDINYPPPASGRELPFKLYIEFLDSFDTVEGGDLEGVIRKILEH